MQQAARAKRVNKTEAILLVIYENGQITISEIMALTGWDRHNIHSTFRKAKAKTTKIKTCLMTIEKSSNTRFESICGG